jgi:hypothetical protein
VSASGSRPEPVGIHDGAVVAPAVNEKIAAAVAADVSERDGLEGLALRRGHGMHDATRGLVASSADGPKGESE